MWLLSRTVLARSDKIKNIKIEVQELNCYKKEMDRMELKEVMQQQSFVIVGDTLNETKFACKIKHAMAGRGYDVQCVGKELSSINETEGQIDIIDLCIRPDKGLELLRNCEKPFKSVVLQPGAGSEEIREFLAEKQIPFIDGCLLVGLASFPKET